MRAEAASSSLRAAKRRGNPEQPHNACAAPLDCFVASAPNEKELALANKPVIASRRLAAWRSRAASTVPRLWIASSPSGSSQ
jgi:hypothetical protein